jgi:hypothetical protein
MVEGVEKQRRWTGHLLPLSKWLSLLSSYSLKIKYVLFGIEMAVFRVIFIDP